MTTAELFNLLVPLVSALLGGVIVAIINHIFTKRKTEAEAKKLEAETQKILLEVKKLSATVTDELLDIDEVIIYDSRDGCDPFDFQGVEGRFWSVSEKKHTGPRGKGELTVKDGILNVCRTNTVGRFEIWLLRYVYDGVEREYIPRNELIGGKRKLRVSCEAKVSEGNCTLAFVIKSEKGDRLRDKRVEVNRNEWTLINLYFRVSPNENCWLRIDNERISRENISFQIRNLVIAERTA